MLSHLLICAGVMELADVTDSKSVDGNIVWVRVPPPAPCQNPTFDTNCVEVRVFVFYQIHLEDMGLELGLIILHEMIQRRI